MDILVKSSLLLLIIEKVVVEISCSRTLLKVKTIKVVLQN